MEGLREELKAEYTMIQSQYEAFDARALQIKSLSGPLIATLVGFGLEHKSRALIAAAIVIALALWALEAIWKSFQYCYIDRIKLLEAWFRGQQGESIAPFQIFTAWNEVWHRRFRHPEALVNILFRPFVYLPYLPLGLFAIGAIVWQTIHRQ